MVNCSDPAKEAERRRKIGDANRGRVCKDETRDKMSAVRKGRPHSKEHAENIGKALKGRVITPEWREKLRQARLGKKASPETREKMSTARTGGCNAFFGKTHSKKTKLEMSRIRIESGLSSGENNPGYVDGRSNAPYCQKWNPSLRRRVRAFFNNTCQMCGHVKQDGEPMMAVHHVNYRKDACCNERTEPLFVTLCPGHSNRRSCHSVTNHDREYWKICFTQLIKNKYGGKCYFTKEEMSEEDVTLWGK